MSTITEPISKENHIIEVGKGEGCAVSTQKAAVQRELEDWEFGKLIGHWTDSRPHPRIANQLAGGCQYYVNL
jgi:hypothetical protein